MDRLSMAVTTAGLLVLVVLFPPPMQRATSDQGPPPGPTGTDCPRPGLGAADTDAVLLCIAAVHQTP